jgi:hypothetical protein
VALIGENGRVLLFGIAVGVATAIVGREFFAPIRRLGRPLAKEAVKTGMAAFEHGREQMALMSEHLSDLVAEAAAERKQSLERSEE